MMMLPRSSVPSGSESLAATSMKIASSRNVLFASSTAIGLALAEIVTSASSLRRPKLSSTV